MNGAELSRNVAPMLVRLLLGGEYVSSIWWDLIQKM